jgi:RNA polymerase sigma factor (TIGR02999 family)
MPAEAAQIAHLLDDVRKGSREAANEVMEAVYTDLRAVARRFFASERPDHTLQPTALVHEAWMRLFSGAKMDWRNRGHLFAVAVRQMRRILVDHGREFRAAKRGNGFKLSLDENCHALPLAGDKIEEVDELLNRLHRLDAEAANVVEMKFFAGMTDEEVALELGCSHSTVRRHWTFAKAWLVHEMKELHAKV